MEFSRQEYWSGLPFPTPGDLPGPGIEPMSLVSPAFAGGFFTTAQPTCIWRGKRPTLANTILKKNKVGSVILTNVRINVKLQ